MRLGNRGTARYVASIDVIALARAAGRCNRHALYGPSVFDTSLVSIAAS
jgi:hypothetical protein